MVHARKLRSTGKHYLRVRQSCGGIPAKDLQTSGAGLIAENRIISSRKGDMNAQMVGGDLECVPKGSKVG